MATDTARPTGFHRARAWIVGPTGVLVVVPALINAGIDVYAAFAKLPKTEAERANVELFKKYFNKQPVAAFPVPIKQSNGTVEVRFSVFEEGDVYVEFGKFTQWFAFARQQAPTRIGPSLLPEAHADDSTQARGFGKYLQNDTFVDGQVLRERRWENGILEVIKLDPRTGDIVDQSARAAPPE